MAVFKPINWLLARFAEKSCWSKVVFSVFTRILPVPTTCVRGVPIKIVIPLNQAGVFESFKNWETREPETLDWIDAFEKDCVFFDVGASFGNETLYAALKSNGPRRIICFDLDLQASFNLAYNLQINRLSNVEQYYLGLSAEPGFIVASEHTNYACVPQRPPYDKIAYKTWGMPLDEFVEHVGTFPDYLKIDVDGFEEHLVRGMSRTLQNPRLKSVLIETNATTRETVSSALQAAGFVLTRESAPIGETRNLIFQRSEKV